MANFLQTFQNFLQRRIPSQRRYIPIRHSANLATVQLPQNQMMVPQLKKLGNFSVSAYNPRIDQTDKDPWIAPRNFNLKEGTNRGGKYVAVARRGEKDPTPIIPYGTKIRIGDGTYEVRDLMGLYADGKPQWGKNRVDIFIPDETEVGRRKALEYGRRNMDIFQY